MSSQKTRHQKLKSYWVMTVYGDMHLKDLMGSIARVGYCIPVLDFYLVLKAFAAERAQ